MFESLFMPGGKKPGQSTGQPLSTAMQKTVQYLGANILIEVDPETSSTRWQVRISGGKEFRVTEQEAKGSGAPGHILRRETVVLNLVTITIDDRQFAREEVRTEELRTWIESRLEQAKSSIDHSPKAKPADILASMGFQ